MLLEVNTKELELEDFLLFEKYVFKTEYVIKTEEENEKLKISGVDINVFRGMDLKHKDVSLKDACWTYNIFRALSYARLNANPCLAIQKVTVHRNWIKNKFIKMLHDRTGENFRDCQLTYHAGNHKVIELKKPIMKEFN